MGGLLAALDGAHAAAVRAGATLRPDAGLEPFASRVLGREHLHQVEDREALAESLARGGLGHCASLNAYVNQYSAAALQIKYIIPFF